MRRVGGMLKVKPGVQELESCSGNCVPSARSTSAPAAAALATGVPAPPGGAAPPGGGPGGGAPPAPGGGGGGGGGGGQGVRLGHGALAGHGRGHEGAEMLGQGAQRLGGLGQDGP